ncbi:hypothetical protein SEEMEL47_20134 [Salmonella enterica subsp. enterica serovar Meleagridis]|nr:hypothetical protein SEPB56_00935 [Salmonella enterica subsp. enterica serovar Paratyphi B str. SARA56]ESG21749.1 hypothetical protein SEEMEL47_20134 [Salmonella enterica subsp. enterica serovar Meleagridis str. 0047]
MIVQVSYLLRVIVDLRHAGANRDIDLFILIAQILIGGFELVYQPFRFTNQRLTRRRIFRVTD